MDQLPLWLSALPKEMQGSLMTIAGGAITALFGGIGWLAKTWNDRGKERIKRQMEMRREVFLPAAESIIEAMSFVGGLANDMRPEAQIQAEFTRLARKVAPLQVVGSDATVHASGEFAAKFTAFLWLRRRCASRFDKHTLKGTLRLPWTRRRGGLRQRRPTSISRLQTYSSNT
ncbi:hypothetical protein ACI2VK_24145 [Ralstonia nicotianae]|nr:hypothetical protein [Ralstonia solanacearum]